jgi:hypothetical protein
MTEQERNQRYYEQSLSALYELLLEFMADAKGHFLPGEMGDRPIEELINWLSRRARGVTPYYRTRPSPEEKAARRAQFGPKPAS